MFTCVCSVEVADSLAKVSSPCEIYGTVFVSGTYFFKSFLILFGEKGNVFRVLERKPEGKRLL